MAVTGKDIAKKMGLSTATVSLALNNRPGVNEATRKAVLACRSAMQREQEAPLPKTVLLLNDQEMSTVDDYGLFNQSYSELYRVLNAHGYLLKLQKYENEPETFRAQLEGLDESIAGIIVFAMDLKPECIRELGRVDLPKAIFDSDIFVPGSDNFLIDNSGGIASALELLSRMGRKEIYYLANSGDGFNFRDRRRAVRAEAERLDIEVHTVELGRTIGEIRQNAVPFLQSLGDRPVNMLMENYQVSFGVLQAANQIQMVETHSIPDHVLPVCFDELPEIALSLIPWKLPMIRISHDLKANMAALRLIERMEGKAAQEFMFTVRTQLINGEF